MFTSYKKLFFHSEEECKKFGYERNLALWKSESFEKAMAFSLGLGKQSSVLDMFYDDEFYYIWVLFWRAHSNGYEDGYIEMYQFSYINNTKSKICSLEFEVSENRKVISLIEMHAYVRDKGYGSTALNHLKCFGNLVNSDRVVGTLSYVDTLNNSDPKNGERLRHFYPKNGFVILGNPPIQKLKYVFPKE